MSKVRHPRDASAPRRGGVPTLVVLAVGAFLLACAGLASLLMPRSRPRAASEGQPRALERVAAVAEEVADEPPAPVVAAALVDAAPAAVAAVTPPPPPPAPQPPAPPPDSGAPTAAELAAAAALVDPNGEYHVKGLPGARPIIAFDPDLWTALRRDRHRLLYLAYAEPVRDCAKAFVLRQGHNGWLLGGIARVRIAVTNGVARFDTVALTDFAPSGNPDRPPDQEFLDCYAAATRRLRIRCPDCKDGSVELPMKVGSRYYDAAGETLRNEVDPDIADSDFWVVPAPR
jgi:hypothetical protein